MQNRGLAIIVYYSNATKNISNAQAVFLSLDKASLNASFLFVSMVKSNVQIIVMVYMWVLSFSDAHPLSYAIKHSSLEHCVCQAEKWWEAHAYTVTSFTL